MQPIRRRQRTSAHELLLWLLPLPRPHPAKSDLHTEVTQVMNNIRFFTICYENIWLAWGKPHISSIFPFFTCETFSPQNHDDRKHGNSSSVLPDRIFITARVHFTVVCFGLWSWGTLSLQLSWPHKIWQHVELHRAWLQAYNRDRQITRISLDYFLRREALAEGASQSRRTERERG